MTTAAATAPGPKKRGPNTPQGKARSAQNARKHGLRARTFALVPGEDPAEWAQHLQECEEGLGPTDAHEKKLVCALAAAMWNEIRADRQMAEVMADIPPKRLGRSHGTDMQEPRHARSMNTALRYMTAAGMATQRAQRAYLAHRRASCQGLIAPARPQPVASDENGTNELPLVAAAAPEPQKHTNEFGPRLMPDPLLALRNQVEALLDGPSPPGAEGWDLVAAALRPSATDVDTHLVRMPACATFALAKDRAGCTHGASQPSGAAPAWLQLAPSGAGPASTGP